MNQPKCLYRGFDGLDVSFTACLAPDALRILREAKSRAEKVTRPVVVQFGPGGFALELAETGARGGYKFRGNSGHLGGTWFIKDRSVPEAGNIRVSIHSETLAIHGLQRTQDHIRAELARMGATFTDESVSRVDFAMDFMMHSYDKMDPAKFVCHARTHIREHAINTSDHNPDEMIVSWTGRRVTSVTIGKMPGRQVIIYDKRAEAISKGKDHWFDIWKIPKFDDTKQIWRVEVRFGKTFLSERARIFTFQDLGESIRKEILSTLNAIRYTCRISESTNVTRASLDPLWHAAKAEASQVLEQNLPRLDSSALYERKRLKALSHRRKLVGSLIPGIVALEGLTAEKGRSLAKRIAAQCASELADTQPRLFKEKVVYAKSRFELGRPGSND